MSKFDQINGLQSLTRSFNPGPRDKLDSFVRRTHVNALQTARTLGDLAKADVRAEIYPDSRLGQQLQLIARLIRAELGTRVVYVRQAGYDTHAGQLPQHQSLLSTLSRSLHAYLGDIASTRLGDRVMVMAFNEFRRRVAENGSDGTDHGTAGPVFLAGHKLQSGRHGATPRLTHLQGGDLKMTIDFRQVYTTLLGDG